MSDSLPPMTDETACICFWTEPSTWTTHYGAVEPGSQREWNPTCPEHGVMAENPELRKELAKARSECAALAAKVGESEEEWAIRVVTEPGGTYSYHNYCDPENPERDLEATLRVLADGHDGYGNPVPHGPVSIVKRTVWSTEWETVEPSGMPHTPAQEAAWSDADRVCAFDGCGESCRHDEENPVPPAQEAQERPEAREGDTGKGTGGRDAHGRTEADR